MSLVSQGGGRYVATVASDVSGGVWDPAERPDMESHLKELILAAFADAGPGGANPLLNLGTEDGGVTVFVQFQADRSSGEVTTLAALIQRASEYFIILDAQGNVIAQPTANPEDAPTVVLSANGVTTKTLTLQMKNGDGSNQNGHAETPTVTPQGLAPVSKPGAFNGQGKATTVLGASGTPGFVAVIAACGAMPQVPFNVQWNSIL